MGCGASKIVEQQPAANHAVDNMKADLNGNAQQVVANSSVVIKPSEQNKPASNTPEKQAEPNQQEAQPVQHQNPEPEKAAPEPEKPAPEPEKPAPEPEKPVSKPVSPEPKKDEIANEEPVVTYTEESLQEFLELQKKLNSMESKGVIGQYQTQHKLLVSRYADLQATQKKVEALKQQT